MDCLCLGGVCTDLVCQPIPALPAQGQLIETDGMELSLGGCAANTAVNLARLGVRTGIAACIGQDFFGSFIRQTLEAAGVDTADLVHAPDASSASAAVINVRGEDRRFIAHAGANRLLSPAMVPEGLIESAAVLYIGGFLMLDGLESPEMLRRLAQARSTGTRIVLDVVQVADANAMARLRAILPYVDVFLPNNDEAAALTGCRHPWEQADAFRAAGAHIVVITSGQRGAHLVSNNTRLHIGSYSTEFVGSTGAGDAFDAGFIAALLDDQDLPTCLRWGSALGASCVRSSSATASVFNRKEALQFMASHPLAVKTF